MLTNPKQQTQELRNKYKGYKIESDIWGNIKATKQSEEKEQQKTSNIV